MSTDDRAVTRPNGKVWRGRNPVRFAEFENYENETGFVVLGTHDEHLALTLLGERVEDYGLDIEQAERTWWRNVPWSDSGHDSSYITDPERGTPCVVFQP